MRNNSKTFMALNAYANLKNLFLDEDDYEHVSRIELTSENVNDVFTALLLGQFLFAKRVLGKDEDMDLIDFIGILTRLAINHITE